MDRNTSSRLTLKTLNNTRDLGGMRTKEGAVIRKGLLIRSGHLFFADDEDIDTLAKINIRNIYDFRSLRERTEKPDPPVGDAVNLHFPIMRDLTEGITREEKADSQAADMIILNIKDDPEFGIRYMQDTYVKMVNDNYAVSQYSEFLRSIAQIRDGAALWHCTAGKDRAGFASVLLQEILGVDRQDIYNDYLDTNGYIKAEIEQIIVMLNEKMGLDGADDAVRDFFSAKEEYLEIIYQYVDKNYGGMQNFIRNAMGIEEELIQKMRMRFLE